MKLRKISKSTHTSFNASILHERSIQRWDFHCKLHCKWWSSEGNLCWALDKHYISIETKSWKIEQGFERVGNDPTKMVKGCGWPLRSSKDWNLHRSNMKSEIKYTANESKANIVETKGVDGGTRERGLMENP